MWVKQVNETWANRKTSFEKSIDEMSLVELEKRYGQVIQSEQNLRRTGSNWSLPSGMSYEEYRYIIKRYDQLVAAGDLSLAGMKTLDKMFSNLRVGDKVEIDALSRQELMEKYSYVWHGKPSIDYEYLFLSDAEKAKKDYIYYRFEALMAEEPIDFRDPAFTEKYIAHINATGKNPFTGEPVSSDVKFMAKHYNTVQAWSILGASLAGGYMDYSDLTSSSGLGSLSDDMDEISKSTKVSIQTTTSDTKGTRINVISQKTGNVTIKDGTSVQNTGKFNPLDQEIVTFTNQEFSPTAKAQSWQGDGLYPGIDNYVDVRLNKGDKIYILESDFEVANKMQSGYATTWEAVEQSGYDSRKLSDSLQIKPYYNEDSSSDIAEYRQQVIEYTVTSDDLYAAFGEKTLANPHFGKGGAPQYFVKDIQEQILAGKLSRGESMPLNNFEISVEEYDRMVNQVKK
ncbi:hypothetical protein [Streptococcus plurextorum]|uniref:hypothetical protein n=1 Tax=Streptococcus plurextorum TaxID=456876 RepID=UPI00041525B5|nr:hypothetical protein [Streptococcus plurextorum]